MKPRSQPPPADTAAPSDWFRSAFDSLYPLIYPNRDDASAKREIDALIRTLGWHPPARVLDIACGAGRHLQALCRAGFNAFGIDLSMTLLRQGADQRQLRGGIVRGDVRRLPFDAAFDYAINLFNSFGYFDDDAANFAALQSMARTLRPGGVLVMDHINRQKLTGSLVPHDVKRLGDLTVESRRTIADSRVIKHMTITHPSGNAEQLTESVRLFSADELGDWFTRAGLKVGRMMGDFDGAALRDDSPRMVLTGVRS